MRRRDQGGRASAATAGGGGSVRRRQSRAGEPAYITPQPCKAAKSVETTWGQQSVAVMGVTAEQVPWCVQYHALAVSGVCLQPSAAAHQTFGTWDEAGSSLITRDALPDVGVRPGEPAAPGQQRPMHDSGGCGGAGHRRKTLRHRRYNLFL